MSTQLFPKKFKIPKKDKLQHVAFRGFGGGWNTVHDDTMMDSRFLSNAKNIIRSPAGGASVRWGSRWYTDLTGTSGLTGTRVIDATYFNGHLVGVTDTGCVFRVDHPEPTRTVVFNTAIAAALPGAPTGWHATEQVDFVHFRDQLIIHNGVDKPITISNVFVATYLNDLASGSNLNVPIGKYGCVVSNYHVVAGVPAQPTTIYVTNAGTAGTFVGDADPNDGIVIDVGAYAPEGGATIRGVAGFRTNLVVFFQTQALVITLGEYEGDVHKPKFPDTMPQHGLLGHRCVASLSHDLLFHGLFGMSSGKRNLFSGLYDTKHLSEYIEPTYRSDTSEASDTEQLLSTFSVFDNSEHSISLYLPSGRVLVYAFNDELNYRGWSYYEDQDWDCACSTVLGRVFFFDGLRIFQKGNNVFADEDYHADKIGDRDGLWTNATAYPVGYLALEPVTGIIWECLIAHASAGTGTFEQDRGSRPTYWQLYEGRAIDFDFEGPWVDGKDPMRVKQLRFGKVGSKGTAEFTLKVYVDNLYKDEEGVEAYDPALSIDLIGNDAAAYGADAGPFGGGRPSRDPRLLAMPCKFMSIKFRYVGQVRKALLITSQMFLFSKGKFRR